MKQRHLLVFVLSSFFTPVFLTGCSLLPERVPTKIYALTPPSITTAKSPTVGWSLVVPRPIADQTLDSDRILVSKS